MGGVGKNNDNSSRQAPVAEIQQANINRRSAEASHRMRNVEKLFKVACQSGDPGVVLEAARYVPLAVVACLENWAKNAIADLVDHGDPFLRNASQMESANVTYEYLLEIMGETLTVGHIISHPLKCNKMGQIAGHMSRIIGTDFLKLMKNFIGAICEHPVIAKRRMGQNIGILTDTFDRRHLFAHYAAPSTLDDVEKAESRIEACIDFVVNGYGMVVGLMYPENLGWPGIEKHIGARI